MNEPLTDEEIEKLFEILIEVSEHLTEEEYRSMQEDNAISYQNEKIDRVNSFK